jgi:hypothetical protein
MKVRAVAVATDRSNAIGVLELECTPAALVLVHLGVGAFREGYAPGALTSGTQVVAPWAAVQEARAEGEQLYLALDPALTPHSRLTLTSFSTGDLPHPRELYRQRIVLRILSFAGASIVAVMAALTAPYLAPRTGSAGAVVVGILAALAMLLVGFVADRRIATGGVDGDVARDAFVGELSLYLPALVRAPHAPRPAPLPLPALVPSFQGLLPRTTFAIVVTLTAASLGAVLVGGFVLHGTQKPAPREFVAADDSEEREAEPPAPGRALPRTRRALPQATQPAAVAAVATGEPPTAAPPAAADAVRASGACRCLRADSPLWDEPLPRLSLLVMDKKIRKRPRYDILEVELAAINNGDKNLRELTLNVEFFERDPPPSNKRYSVSHRALYFEGPLTPGQAVKWSVEAQGTEIEVQNPVSGDIGPSGDAAAPTNLIAQLLDANNRPVRLHGAMLLAFLGDPRAREAALRLQEALREDEAPYLERVLRAVGDLRVCDLRITGTTPTRSMSACVFNASGEARRDLGLKVRALDNAVRHAEPVSTPPNVLGEPIWKIPGELAPQAGVRVEASFDTARLGTEPVAYEAAADRVDLLR